MLQTLHDASPSFEGVYRAHFAFVWRTLRALGVVPSAIDDAAQDVFVVVHRRLAAFEGRASVKTWLYEITRRVAMRYRSRAATDAVRTFELPDLRASEDLDAAVDRAMAAEVLRAFVANLDEDRQRAFILAEFWDMPGREIAEALDANMNTIYARLRSARTELDRMAARLHARDAGALTRVMRTSQPSAATKERTWAGVVAKLGMSAVPAAAAGSGSLGIGLMGWGAVTIAATVVVAATVAMMGPSQASSSGTKPRVVAAPTEVVHADAPSAVPMPRPPEPAAEPAAAVLDLRAGRPPSTPPRVSVPGPSLDDELARIEVIRAAVTRRDFGAAEAEVARYRTDLPSGTLALEVDALAVEIACRAGSDDAAHRLEALRQRHVERRLTQRLEKICPPSDRSTKG